MCCNFMISIAARCSLVCGCGQGSFPAMSNNAASMTAAPFNIVAMRISWPGQSTKETCRRRRIVPSHPGLSQGGLSSLFEEYDL